MFHKTEEIIQFERLFLILPAPRYGCWNWVWLIRSKGNTKRQHKHTDRHTYIQSTNSIWMENDSRAVVPQRLSRFTALPRSWLHLKVLNFFSAHQICHKGRVPCRCLQASRYASPIQTKTIQERNKPPDTAFFRLFRNQDLGSGKCRVPKRVTKKKLSRQGKSAPVNSLWTRDLLTIMHLSAVCSIQGA